MNPIGNHESHWLLSFFILFYLLASKFSAVLKSQSFNFSHKLSNRQFMEFAIFMLNVVNSLSVFSKVSQDKHFLYIY